MKLSVISPTFNEAKNIPALIETLTRALNGLDYEIIISDDDSPDLTWAVVEEIASRNPRVRLLRRTTNRGLGASVIDAFSCATGEAVACIDADLQHDPALLPEMLKELVSGADLVIGSRYVAGGSTGKWSQIRYLESWVATKLAQCILGVRICDPMSGYFMMRRADFMRVRESLDGRGFKILLEIAARLKPSKVSEVPYIFGTRVAGNSKLSGMVIYAYLVQLWKLSPMAKVMPAQFTKFAVVGSSGVLVNLGVMGVIISLTPYRDWHASTVATFVATVNNYVFNNFWTFRDRAHSGGKFVRRYIYYLIASLFGLAVTTSMFAMVSWTLAQILGRTSSTLQTPLLLLCQLLAILSGTLLNYALNKTMTWPKADGHSTVSKISSPVLGNSASRRWQ